MPVRAVVPGEKDEPLFIIESAPVNVEFSIVYSAEEIQIVLNRLVEDDPVLAIIIVGCRLRSLFCWVED